MKKFFSNYIFILIPFVVLIVTKGVVAQFQGVFTSTDWSIASFMIIAQCMSFIITNSQKSYPNLNKYGLNIFIGITIIFLILCIGVYAYSLYNPSSNIAYGQPLMFLISSIWMMGVYKADDYLRKL
ncbi:TPA: hypothetical protein ACGGCQ_003571 [Vibrio cholerae]|uniref:Uncharacterized protein n=1 Tax=Vibrio paracholerae TaxID=650003 RepID=A0AAX1QQV8_9VIBR|nr:hypothetical protein DLR69_12300 [Vibrio paracholerae]RBM78326.1 hypothetical protein DLR70_14115 [Vibrio paracholerae]HCZ9568041.1 hypothetical protein [Vibrio cholerae]